MVCTTLLQLLVLRTAPTKLDPLHTYLLSETRTVITTPDLHAAKELYKIYRRLTHDPSHTRYSKLDLSFLQHGAGVAWGVQ